MIIIWIIIAIILFSIIVLIHEFGHFKAARYFWVKVEEFWLGIPPRAKKLWKDKAWTLYSLNWLPLWGFVKLAWENQIILKLYNDKWKIYKYKKLKKDIKNNVNIFNKNKKKLRKEEINELKKLIKKKDASYNLNKKPALQQSIIILAWVFMNFLFASIIFSILFFIWVKPIWINTKIQTNLDLKIIPNFEQSLKSWLLVKKEWLLITPLKDSIAEKAWLKKWMFLVKINNKKLFFPEDMIKIVQNNSWKKINLKWYKNNPNYKKWCGCTEKEVFEINLKVWSNWKIWTYIWENIELNKNFKYKYGLVDSIKYWFYETYNQSLLTLKALYTLWKKVFNPKIPKERQEAIAQVSWPIWLVNFITNSIPAWIVFIIILTAIISINLWVFNLLPIPALDWWRFIFILINSIIKNVSWKEWINQSIEWFIHALFFIFLIALSLIIAYNDIVKIIID